MDTILSFLFPMFAVFVIYKICQPKKAHFISILSDVNNGLAIYRKWHYHAAIAMVLGALLVHLFTAITSRPQALLIYLLAVGVGSALCWVWEAIQGLLGANKTESEAFEMRKDIIVGSFFVAIGAAIVTIIS